MVRADAPSGRARHRLFAAAVIASTIVLGLFAAELVTRRLDGYRLWSVRLVRLPSPIGVDDQFREKWVDPKQAARYVGELPVAPGVDRAWFWWSPAPFAASPFDPDLVKQMQENPAASLQSVYVWNQNNLRRTICQDAARSETIFANIARLFVFPAPAGDLFPTFRFVANAHYPTGLHTNAFGWRGAAIALRKPARTIRIAFVGASTTVAAHGEPWSYPELVGRWLNEWASARHIDVHFETINAGREGINSHSIASIVEQELIPVEPDLIVYYEGSNQFWPDSFVKEHVGSRPIQEFVPPRFPLDSYLAVSGRLHSLGELLHVEGAEPPKAPLTVEWPASLSETDPDLNDPRLPVSLPEILHDLDRIRIASAEHGAELTVASFMWLVYDRMIVNRRRDAMLFAYLNGSFGSFPYAHMRRYADFQNRVFAKYARTHGLEFIDYASEYPRDPRLFYDAIHMTTAGIRLQAWIMFNNLVPIVERRIAARRLPRAAVLTASTHPAFVESDRRTIPTDSIRSACDQ
jgi:hypothetical protein